MSDQKNLRFAILGCGRIANRHAEHISNFGELIGVCDVDSSKAEKLAKSYDCVQYDDYSTMLEKCNADVICVCTPNGLHCEHSTAALRSGFHVLCEKPMALNVDDCGKMIDQSLKSNRMLFIVKQNRFNPPVAAVKKAIDENRFGKILSLQLNCFWNRDEAYYENSWKGTAELDGGVLFTQFSHFIDLLYWLNGDIKSTSGLKGNFAHEGTIDFEDSGVAILEFQNGAIGSINYTINSHGRNMEGSLTIFGEKGTVKIGGQYLNELEYQNIEGYKIEGLVEGNPANNYGHYQGSMSNHADVYANVVDVLSGGGSIATNGYEGLKTVEMITKIYSFSDHIRNNK